MMSDLVKRAVAILDDDLDQAEAKILQRWKRVVERYDVVKKGGPGSGHFGHSGRPGKVGGSMPSGGVSFQITSPEDYSTFYDEYSYWLSSLSDMEKRALDNYTSSGYITINDHLRHNTDVYANVSRDISALRDAIDRSSVPNNIIVYRGVRQPFLDSLRARVGDVFTDAGFVSTTFDKDLAVGRSYRQGYIELRVPQGTRGGIGSFSESELILQSGTKFRIVSVDSDYVLDSSVVKIVAEVVQ